jgi:hypothetical protein
MSACLDWRDCRPGYSNSNVIADSVVLRDSPQFSGKNDIFTAELLNERVKMG